MRTVLLTSLMLLSTLQCTKKSESIDSASSVPKNFSTAEIEQLPLVSKTFKESLLKEVATRMSTEGAAVAVSYCHEKALPLTDSIAQEHQLRIYRVSDKPRNSKNTPSSSELALINYYKAKLLEGKKLKDSLSTGVYYSPLVTSGACLKCHGTPGTLSPKALAVIKEKYPADQATGYKEGEVRGLVVITPVP